MPLQGSRFHELVRLHVDELICWEVLWFYGFISRQVTSLHVNKVVDSTSWRVRKLTSYSQTELGLQSHRCIVNKQKSSLSSVQGFTDAVLRNVLHPSNTNFPKAILFDYSKFMC